MKRRDQSHAKRPSCVEYLYLRALGLEKFSGKSVEIRAVESFERTIRGTNEMNPCRQTYELLLGGQTGYTSRGSIRVCSFPPTYTDRPEIRLPETVPFTYMAA